MTEDKADQSIQCANCQHFAAFHPHNLNKPGMPGQGISGLCNSPGRLNSWARFSHLKHYCKLFVEKQNES